jgi:hypothetical protein
MKYWYYQTSYWDLATFSKGQKRNLRRSIGFKIESRTNYPHLFCVKFCTNVKNIVIFGCKQDTTSQQHYFKQGLHFLLFKNIVFI